MTVYTRLCGCKFIYTTSVKELPRFVFLQRINKKCPLDTCNKIMIVRENELEESGYKLNIKHTLMHTKENEY
jgi:hypothetical protein